MKIFLILSLNVLLLWILNKLFILSIYYRMAKCLSTPNILWRIENFSSAYKKLSPTIRFMGLKCHLILFHYIESGTAKLQLNLECQNASQALKLQSWKFNIDVGIVYCDYVYLTKNGIYDLTSNVWCIWTEFIPEIHQSVSKIKDVTFLTKITLTRDLNSIFKTKVPGKFFLLF